MRLRRRASRKSPQRTAKTQTLGSPPPRRAARVPQEQCPYEIGDGDSPSGFFQTARRWFSERRSRSWPIEPRSVGSRDSRSQRPRNSPARRTRPPARARGVTAMSSVGASSGWRSAVFNRRTLHVCAFAALLHFKPSEPHLGGCPPAIPLALPVTIPARQPPPRRFHNLTPPPLASTPSLTSYLSQSPTSRTSRVSPTRRSRATSSP